MPEASLCSECGTALPLNWPKGLCSACALRGALELSNGADDVLNAEDTLGTSPLPRPTTAGQFPTLKNFGDYELLEEIARGGMGIVYRARQKGLDRIVAVKLLLFGSQSDDDLVRRFKVEATAAGSLHHPNIVAIHEVGLHDGQHFLVMDFVDGPNLAKLVRDQPLPAKRAAAYVQTIAEAIHSAHEKNILHRDLKPSNVLIDANDQPRVTDFGLARRLDGDSSLTLSGQVLGSPNYMPPEQAAALHEKVSRRSDVYGLGAILYHLLTGRPPFQGATIADTVHQVVNSEPATPRVVNPDVPLDLETICLKCLQKEPARRYSSAHDLSEELGRALRDQPIHARPVSRPEKVWRWCRRKPALAASLAMLHVVLILGLAGILWQWHRAEANAHAEAHERSRAETNALAEAQQRMEAEQLVTRLEIRTATDLLQADDAPAAVATLAQVLRKAPANRAAAEALLSTLTQRGFPLPAFPPLKHAAAVTSAEFSPDGQWIISTAGRKAQVWDAHSGQPAGPPLAHAGLVVMAQFSPDSRRVVTCSADKTARVWDVATGQSIGPALVHTATANWAEFSPDGRWLVTVSDDKTAQVWNALDGTARGKAVSHREAVNRAHFSPDGRRIVTASKDGTARVWSAETGEALTPGLKHGGEVHTAEFSPDGQAVVTACMDGKARVWDAHSGQIQNDRISHSGSPILTARFSPDGQRVVTAAYDQSACVWDVRTGQPNTPLLKHRSYLLDARFSLDGQRVVTASFDRTARVWDASTGQPLSERLRHDNNLNGVSFSARGNFVLTFSEDKSVRVWRLQPAQPLGLLLPHDAAVNRCDISPDGRRVATTSYDRTAAIWDAQDGRRLAGPLKHAGAVACVRFSPDGQRVVTGSGDNTAAVWNAHTGERLAHLVGHRDFIRVAEFSPDGQSVLTSSRDGTARVWDAQTGQPRFNPLQHRSTIWTASFSPDGRLVATAAWDNTARLWDAQTGEPRSPPLMHGHWVHTARFSPDGRWLLTASSDQTARVWDTQTGKERFAPLKHESPVQSAEFSPDGKWIVTASDDWTARVWEAQTGRPVARLAGHEGKVLWARFNPDSRQVVTASEDKSVRVWDGLTAQPLMRPLIHGGVVNHVSFSPSGPWVLTSSADHAARLWEVPEVTAPVPEWLPAFAEALAGQKLDATGLPQSVPFENLIALQEQVRRGAGTDTCSRWVKWFLSEAPDRTISPSSGLTVESYVQQRIAQNTLDSLHDAMRLSPNNGLALARMARVLLQQTTNDSSGTSALAEGYSRVAAALSPDEAEAWWARAEAFERAGDWPQALAALRRAGELAPNDPSFLMALGELLERREKFEEALSAYSQVVELASSPTNTPNVLRKKALLQRRAVLVRLNRPEAAQNDFLLARNISIRGADTPSNCLDLAPWYNTTLTENWNDPDNSDWSLERLPRGHQVLGGTAFDVRGMILVSGIEVARVAPQYPARVDGLWVNRECQSLHFLHASVWSARLRAGTRIGGYVVHYADGQEVEIPIIHGEDMLESQIVNRAIPELKGGTVVWTGQAPNGRALHLFKRTWANPRPTIAISRIDFTSAMTMASPFLIAITAE